MVEEDLGKGRRTRSAREVLHLHRILGTERGTDSGIGIKKRLKDFDPQDISLFAGVIIVGIGQNSRIWDADKRADALAILGHVIGQVDHIGIVHGSYVRTVVSQSKTADPWGSINSLLEAGKIIAPHLPRDGHTIHTIRTAWNGVDAKMKGNLDWLMIRGKVDEITAILDSPADERAGSSTLLYKRPPEEHAIDRTSRIRWLGVNLTPDSVISIEELSLLFGVKSHSIRDDLDIFVADEIEQYVGEAQQRGQSPAEAEKEWLDTQIHRYRTRYASLVDQQKSEYDPDQAAILKATKSLYGRNPLFLAIQKRRL